MQLSTALPSEIKYGLALGGGGLSGAYALGVRRALLEHFKLSFPSFIIASSISTSTACLNTIEQIEGATDIWLNQAPNYNIMDASSETLRLYYKKVAEMIRGGISETFLQDQVPPTYFCLTDAETGQPESVRVDQLESMDHFYQVMAASMALPGLSDPVEWKNALRVDGDLSWSAATRSHSIRQQGIENIIAIECCTRSSLFEIVNILNQIENKRIKKIYRDSINRALNFKPEPSILIAPSQTLETGIFNDNSKEAIQAAIHLGYQNTLNHLGVRALAVKIHANPSPSLIY